MPRPFHADLHCHSTFSDGTLSPAALAQRAQANGVTLWALTDHDEVAGLPQAQSAAHACGLDFLTGVEISVSFANTTVHIVGLGFDADNPALQQGLHALRNSRGPRAQEMGLQLAAAGIPNAYEGALKYVGNPALISRTHFARYLVEAGVCRDTYEVFKHYLVEGKPGYAPQRWASLEEAVGWITHAHGVAVIAHPARYGFSHTEELWRPGARGRHRQSCSTRVLALRPLGQRIWLCHFTGQRFSQPARIENRPGLVAL
jgi:predicted metal-dependent phosphoesterase TrpH